MSTAANPFRPTRWEHHSGNLPLIWFSPTAQLLAQDKSAFVYGTRGSGKTTLLRSICWEDLVGNPSLKLQRTLGDFNHLGIYIRFPDHISSSFSSMEWKSVFPLALDPELEFHRHFSLAIELLCLERALTAVHELRLLNQVAFDATAELQFTADFLAEYPSIEKFSNKAPRTFLDLSRVLRTTVRQMNEASGRGVVKDVAPLLPAREPNEFLQNALERLSGIVRISATAEDRRIGFKFCLDDCEVLSSLQKKSLNTLVRKSGFPISWVISSVDHDASLSDTFSVQQPLTEADRRVISLNRRNRFEFSELCQAVASLRAYFAIPSDNRPVVDRDSLQRFFDLELRLGRQDVNDIIHSIIAKSTSSYAAFIKAAASELASVLKINRPRKKQNRVSTRTLPYYEAYILLHWNGGEAFSTTADVSDLTKMREAAEKLQVPAFHAWMRRKMVGALLHLSSKLKFRHIPYAGANIVVTLADGSIRDFLEIMAEIYEQYVQRQPYDSNHSLEERFAKSRTKIAADAQRRGIAAASDSFVSGISSHTEFQQGATWRVITALARLTAKLQSDENDPSVLGRAERGIFVFDFSKRPLVNGQSADLDPDLSLVQYILQQAELAGYLREEKLTKKASSGQFTSSADSNFVAYRLHRRFAPYFQFSFRGAYEPIRVDSGVLAEIARLNDEADVSLHIDHLFRRTRMNEHQLTLPFDRASENDS